MSTVIYQVNPPADNASLNVLFAAAWDNHSETDFAYLLTYCMTYICAYHDEDLVGFVKLAWDGGEHAFLLDTTVHPAMQRQGIGQQLVMKAVQAAREHGIMWVHVDYEPHLDGFYRGCGFRPTLAGLINTTVTTG
jgi:GNAT superfamily N-acetyltransferase